VPFELLFMLYLLLSSIISLVPTPWQKCSGWHLATDRVASETDSRLTRAVDSYWHPGATVSAARPLASCR
jgi:hypothetical protein